ncbi:MAG TPA: serine hydrolase [Gemmatimonadales bacterium]|jgi:beta-lactamase class A|nr:serine hydrolase [Gemmatimonadales bacterium]
MRLLAVGVVLALAPRALEGQTPPRGTADKPAVLWAKLERGVAAIDAGLDGVLAVAIKDLSDGRTLLLHADAVMPTASTIKLAILAELYRQEQRGEGGGGGGGARLADAYVADSADVVPGSDLLAGLTFGVTRLTNRDLATFMIGVSDNGATNVLIRRVGMERVNALLDSLGLKQTRLRRRMLDLAAARAGRENTATAQELVALLEALWSGRVVRGALRDDFFRVLATPKERYLPRLLPEQARIASKPGWLEGVRVDAGIGFAPNRPFAIAVMITYAGDERAAEQAISELGLLAWRHFERLGGGGAYGRRIP